VEGHTVLIRKTGVQFSMALPEFTLNEKEKERAEKWLNMHIKKHPRSQRIAGEGGRGPTISYEFTPTGIGMGIFVKCVSCGAAADVTDYDSW
jgi:hypothetical protein